MRSRYVFPLLLAFALWLSASQPALCDRVILTPSGTTLFTNQASLEAIHSFSDVAPTGAWANLGFSRMELEGAYFHIDNRDAVAMSVETPILPETFATPALAVGIRDIFNSTRDVSGVGYGGRAYYVAATKIYPSLGSTTLFKNIVFTGGIGAGSIHGPFGSVSANMPLDLIGTFEYDGTRANLRFAIPLSQTARIEYTRIGDDGFVGFQLNAAVSL